MRLLLLLAAVGPWLAPTSPRAEEEIGEGRPAPGFTLWTLNEESSGLSAVALDRYAGAEPTDPDSRVVLLSFFASWCGPCRKEMPYLQQLHLMYRDQGLRVLSVDIDTDPAGIGEARKLAAQARVTFPVLSDRFNLLARRYLGEQSPLPSVFLIQRDGTVARVEKGYGKDAASFLLVEVQRALGLSVNRSARGAGAAASAP